MQPNETPNPMPTKKVKVNVLKLKFFKDVTKFSTWQLIAFATLFAATGGYIISRAFAAGAPIATIQAEQMTLPSGASTVNDSTASAGQAVRMTQGGTSLTSQVSLPSNATSVGLTAKGTYCQGGWPKVSLKVDGKTALPLTTVASSSWHTYSVNVALTAATHNLTITYSNAYGCHRNLYVDDIIFYGPTPPTVALSGSPASVTAGSSSTLTWSSTNATSCTASGGWSGTKPTSGSTSTAALNQSSTYSLACTGVGGSASATATVTIATPAYTFDDEFDGANGTAPSKKWQNDVGTWTPNKEREYYTGAGINDYLDGAGHLVIQPTVDNGSHQCWYGTCSFDSARITTLGSFSQAYGTWTARIKMNPQLGLWPAFWFMGSDINTVSWPACGEIDGMENFGYTAWSASLHGSAVGNDIDFGGGYAAYNTSPTDWHEYGVKVTPDSIAFMFDGTVYGTETKAAFIAKYGASSWPFDKPFFPILNVAVGGSGTNYVLPTSPLSPMLVDYVRFTAQ